MAHAAGYYRTPDGRQTSEVGAIRSALRLLIELFGPTRAADFSPTKLMQVQKAMIDAGQCRTGINRQVHRIRRMFVWAVAHEHVRPAILTALKAVPALRAGRSAAVEKAPIEPVEMHVVEATLPKLSSVVADMVRLQLLTGARPGEIVALRPCDVTFGTDGTWTYRPATHKTQWRGKERRIFLGPQAQELLRPYLAREPDAPCFSPIEAEAQRHAKQREERQSPMTPSQEARTPKARPKRTPSDRYTKDSYRRAVARGCEHAFAMPKELRYGPKDETPKQREERRAKAREWRAAHTWHPNQLRHTRATALRAKYGIEASKVVLGHSDLNTAEIYAEKDFAKAAQIMAEVG